MCIGMPLQVVACEAHQAWCEAWTGDTLQRECLDMSLVGAQPVGTWVLGFLGAARQVLSTTEAAQALAARQALAAVLHGPDRASADIDHWFADLVGRTPELPAHLRPAPAADTVDTSSAAVQR
jgi:hydrogenase expression/formation protein HypC